MAGKLKVAAVGVGHLGQHHARIYSTLQSVELVAVVDTDEKVLTEVSQRTGAPAFRDYRAIIDLVDAVSIAVPTVGHYAIARDFLEAGKSVLVEKPMTASLFEARSLVELAARRKAVLQVGHIERFNPAYMAIRKYKVQPKFIEVHRLSPFKFRSADIGVVLDLMIHDIDLVLSLVNSRVRSVEAMGVSVVGGHEDVANARISFECGCVANLSASRVSYENVRRMQLWSM